MSLAICAAGLVLGQPVPWDDTRVEDAAQDATGQVWAISREWPAGIFRWDGRRWAPVDFPQVGAARPAALGRNHEGAVLCLWQVEGTNGYLLSQHTGTTCKLVAKFTVPVQTWRVFADSRGRVWLTGTGPGIYRLLPTGQAVLAYSIAPEQYHHVGRPRHAQPAYNPVQAVEDGQGRIWFWSNPLPGAFSHARLRGVLIFDGEKFEHHGNLSGVRDDKVFAALERKDGSRLWLALYDDALYELDTSTLIASRVPEPRQDAFRYVQRILLSGDDWYVVSGPVWHGDAMSVRVTSLWRLREGQWQEVIEGIDERFGSLLCSRRPYLTQNGGLWLGSFGCGAWFVPSDGSPPTQIDWRLGFPLTETNRFLHLPDGRLLAVAFSKRSVAVKPSDLLTGRNAPQNIRTFTTRRRLVRDGQGHLWGIRSARLPVLSQWDGEKWHAHPLPPEVRPDRVWHLAIDTRQRVWLTQDSRDMPVGIFDPTKNSFQAYPNYVAALHAQLGQHQGLRVGRDEPMVASFSPDGRICFLDVGAEVTYFDGQTWLKWRSRHVTGGRETSFDGPPFFNRTGNLSVNIAGQTWVHAEGTGWQAKSYELGFADRDVLERAKAVQLPPGCITEHPESIVCDAHGAFWLTWKNQLYKARPGLCVPVFGPDEVHPFLEGRPVLSVLGDCRGNAFLFTGTSQTSAGFHYVVLTAPGPLPDTELKVNRESEDTFALQFSSTATDKAWFIWRMDGNPWSAPTTDPRVSLHGLPSGKHRVEVAAIDSRLQMDPTPAEETIEVLIEPEQQIAQFIARLGSKDIAEREAAVAGLARQPARALPALKTAREKANPDQRWWIDAAIQLVEDALRKAPSSRERASQP
ncbi:MAG: hypothetical protein FJ279_16065 [Planctomycetes bacterium]|nr:hypothetical protein [Planctomycetota bacterium]